MAQTILIRNLANGGRKFSIISWWWQLRRFTCYTKTCIELNYRLPFLIIVAEDLVALGGLNAGLKRRSASSSGRPTMDKRPTLFNVGDHLPLKEIPFKIIFWWKCVFYAWRVFYIPFKCRIWLICLRKYVGLSEKCLCQSYFLSIFRGEIKNMKK